MRKKVEEKEEQEREEAEAAKKKKERRRQEAAAKKKKEEEAARIKREQEEAEKIKKAQEAERKSFDAEISSKPLPYADEYKATPPGDIGKKKELEKSTPKISGDYSCTTVKYKATAEYNESILLDPAPGVFFPGSMIKGESIETGGYTPIGADNRTPMTMSISLENISGKVSRDFTPRLSEARQAIADILSQELTGATPARVSFVIETIYNKEQLNLAVGAGFQYSGGLTNVDISSQFDFTRTTTKSRFLVKFIQQYYSIDVEAKATAADYFKDITKENPRNISGMPLYVHSMKYGRMVLFSVESTDSEQNVERHFRLVFRILRFQLMLA